MSFAQWTVFHGLFVLRIDQYNPWINYIFITKHKLQIISVTLFYILSLVQSLFKNLFKESAPYSEPSMILIPKFPYQLSFSTSGSLSLDVIGYLLWIAHESRIFRQSVGCFQRVYSQTSSYYEIASDEGIQSSNSHN